MTLLCIWLAKLIIWTSRKLGHSGTNAAGKIVVRLYPRILTYLAAQVKKDIFIVCGTNGKTSVNNLICEVLTKTGGAVVCNNLGANMIEGVIVAFIDKCSLSGKLGADFATFEVDEGYVGRVLEYFKPSYIVLCNLFHDQLDRYGDALTTADMLERAFLRSPETKLILNGDDPNCVQFSKKLPNKCIFFGIDQDLNDGNEAKNVFCRFCGGMLKYEFFHYSQLGKFKCSSCDFARPALDCAAADVSFDNGVSFSVGGSRIETTLRGVYNVYNTLAVYTAVSCCGMDTRDFSAIVNGYKTMPGRMEEFHIGGKKLILNLAKNPAGFNQAINAVTRDARGKDVILAINNTIADGQDTSWLWDVDFSLLRENTRLIQTHGSRMYDTLLRLKYSGFPDETITAAPSMAAALETALAGGSEIIYVLANYSALYMIRPAIVSKSEERGVRNEELPR